MTFKTINAVRQTTEFLCNIASFSRYKLVINELDFVTDDKEWFDRISQKWLYAKGEQSKSQ